jgi:hypothetical protein
VTNAGCQNEIIALIIIILALQYYDFSITDKIRIKFDTRLSGEDRGGSIFKGEEQN